jgi:hypothetical protein
MATAIANIAITHGNAQNARISRSHFGTVEHSRRMGDFAIIALKILP